MKVLWLCSWYPNEKDPFDGDFIERQARALALHHPVDVIHFVQNIHLLKNKKFKLVEKQENNIHTRIYYLPISAIKIKLLQKLIFNYSYNTLFKKELSDYITKNGKPDIVHVHVPAKAGVVALWLKKKYNTPFVVTEHSSAYYKSIPENYFIRNNYFQLITKQTFQQAEVVSSVSNWLLNRLNEVFIIKHEKLIRNVVDVSLFFPVESVKIKKRFIHVSMMHPLKNVNEILRALAILNKNITEWEMSFIGPASKENLKLSFDLGLSKQIAWKGALPYSEVANEMQQADVLIHFSKYENLPCVVNEALCCGLPVISSNVGGISELVNDSNGILVENENIVQLANALASYLQHPDRFNKQIISKSASAMFNYNFIGNEMMKLYKDVLKKD
jgi:glycosyltransferase involved in cell wall biosynthesis